MRTTNPTLTLIDMLVEKHELNREKTIQYVQQKCQKAISSLPEKYQKHASIKLFLSGFIYNLSINNKGLRTKLK